MTINVEQFQQVFFEECSENLDILEQGLLAIGNANADKDIVNQIFRAAHSIKGGAATFNFIDIAEITHELESILDRTREGKQQLLKTEITQLLLVVDAVRKILEMRKSGSQDILIEQEELINSLKTMLDSDDSQSSKTDSPNSNEQQADIPSSHQNSLVADSWVIDFIPNHQLFLTGNDPIRFIRELDEFGQLLVKTNIANLPDWQHFDSEQCYLSWSIQLTGEAKREDIVDVFEWIIDDCQIKIDPLKTNTAEKPEEQLNETVEKSDNEQPAMNVGQQKVMNGAQQHQNGKPDQSRTLNSSSQSIRVSIDKIDNLFNLVGELVITQSMLSELGSRFSVENLDCVDRLQSGLAQLLQNTKELQESVMQVRMVPISFIFNRFPRIVHDLASQLNKKVDLVIEGEGTELDKNVMEQLADPLVHLVRNSLDHGIESENGRLQLNKPVSGTIKLSACHRGGNIIIEIFDDGAGLNKQAILKQAQAKGLVKSSEHLSDTQIFDLIFEAGFSTAAAITDISGRGVGMDVVRKNIYSLGGSISVESERDTYTRFQITLPLTLAILDGQLVKVGSETYVIPLNTIVESLQMIPEAIQQVSGALEVYRLRQENIPIIRLYELFKLAAANTKLENALVVVVEVDGNKFGLLVDDLLAQQQVVIKSLEANYDKVPGISGATILGDGTVALILDVSGLVRLITDEFFVKSYAA